MRLTAALGESRLRQERTVPAWLQPVALLDLCHARRVDIQKLLHNTSLFLEDLPFRETYISLDDYEQLCINANRLWPGDDFPFQYGHQLANTGLGPLRTLLELCNGVEECVNALCGYAFLLNPSLRLRYCQDESGAYVLVLSAASRLALSHLELITAMTSLKQLLSKRYPGSVISAFLSSPGRYAPEHYVAHLSADCDINAPLDGLRLSLKAGAPREAVAPVSLQYQVLCAECDQAVAGRGFLIAALRDYLQACREPPGLPDCARYLGTSVSTLKRRLGEQHCSFQAVLDSARREQALIELLVHGASIESISEQLHFHDSSNFRRAFKRWTGSTPSLIKSAYALSTRY